MDKSVCWMTNIIMYHKKLDGRGAMCGWQRLSKYNGVAPSECARVCAVLCMCVLSLQAILLMFPAVNPLLGYLLYKAAKWLACMKKSCLKCFCAHIHCPQYKDSEGVWEGDERKQSKGERHSYRNTNIYREKERDIEREEGGSVVEGALCDG